VAKEKSAEFMPHRNETAMRAATCSKRHKGSKLAGQYLQE